MFPKWLSVPCIGVAMDNEEGPCNDFVFSRTSLVSELNRSISENNQDAWNGNAPHAYVLDKSAQNPIVLHRIPMCSSPVSEPLYAELSPQPMGCPYRYAGCQWNSLVISVAKHLQQNVSEHLQLVHAHTKKQDERIAGLKRNIGDASASKNGTLFWRISNVSTPLWWGTSCMPLCSWLEMEQGRRTTFLSISRYCLASMTQSSAGPSSTLSHSPCWTRTQVDRWFMSLKHSFLIKSGLILTGPLKSMMKIGWGLVFPSLFIVTSLPREGDILFIKIRAGIIV